MFIASYLGVTLEWSEEKMNEYDDTLRAYMKEIAKKPVLTREQEVELFKRLERGEKGAREEITEANLRFVVKIALQYVGKGLSLADLIQEGNMGLMEVIDKFEWRKGYRFSTYAAFWIRQTIQLAIRRSNSMVKLPFRKARLMGKISEFINSFFVNNGREPTEEEIVKGMHIEKGKLDSVMPWRESILSLDSHVNNSADYNLYQFVSSDDSQSARERFQEKERHDKIKDVLSVLSERERKVVLLRYGFGGKEPLSLRQASKIIGLSQEGVRKIEKRALEKLRRPNNRSHLSGLL